jgi:hypothetical protein
MNERNGLIVDLYSVIIWDFFVDCAMGLYSLLVFYYGT